MLHKFHFTTLVTLLLAAVNNVCLASPELTIEGITANASLQLDCLHSIELRYSDASIETISLDESYIEWTDGQAPMTHVLEGKEAELTDGKACIALEPLTNDLQLAGSAQLIIKGNAQVNGEVLQIDELIPFSTFTLSLDEETYHKWYTRSDLYSFHFKILTKNLEVQELVQTRGEIEFYQYVNGEKVILGNTWNFYIRTTPAVDPEIEVSASLLNWGASAPQPGPIFMSGELYYYDSYWFDPDRKLCTMHLTEQSFYYLPTTSPDREIVADLSELQTFILNLPEGVAYTDPDFTGTSVYYYRDADDSWSDPVTVLQAPAASLSGSTLSLNFDIPEGADIDSRFVYIDVFGSIEADGRLLNLRQNWGYRHPNFKGELRHVRAYSSNDTYEPDYLSKHLLLCGDYHTALMLTGAYDASFVEASGRIFTLCDDQEVTLFTLSDVDTQGLQDGKESENRWMAPYVVLNWEQVDEAANTDIYCDMTATFVVDGQTFEYHSDPSVPLGSYFHKLTPSIAEGTVLQWVYDLHELTFTRPDYLTPDEVQNLCYITVNVEYETSWMNTRKYFYPTCEGDVIHSNIDFTYSYLPDEEEPIGYTVNFWFSKYEEGHGGSINLSHTYHYSSQKGAGIEEIATKPAVQEVYTIQGMPVHDSDAKGLLIRNGRKILTR